MIRRSNLSCQAAQPAQPTQTNYAKLYLRQQSETLRRLTTALELLPGRSLLPLEATHYSLQGQPGKVALCVRQKKSCTHSHC
jgi:hypothetical protein